MIIPILQMQKWRHKKSGVLNHKASLLQSTVDEHSTSMQWKREKIWEIYWPRGQSQVLRRSLSCSFFLFILFSSFFSTSSAEKCWDSARMHRQIFSGTPTPDPLVITPKVPGHELSGLSSGLHTSRKSSYESALVGALWKHTTGR